MTEKEKNAKIQKTKENILDFAEDLEDARKRGDIEGICSCAEYIMSEYAWLQTVKNANVDSPQENEYLETWEEKEGLKNEIGSWELRFSSNEFK